MPYLFLLILSLQITACSLTSPVKVTPVNTYTLSATSSISSMRGQENQQVLLITTPIASPGYQTSNMIYTQRPFELNSFAENRWAAPPADMLIPLLTQNLQASGCFRAVVSSPFTGSVDLTLDTRLLNLQQEFKSNTSQVRLALQLTLSNNRTHQVVANQRIEAVIPASSNDPYAGVVAANKAMDVLLRKTRQFVCHNKDS